MKRYGVAFFIDLHGQSHPDVRIELGYQHSAKDLAASDEQLNGPSYLAKSSIQLIAKQSLEPYSQLVRGPASLGALLEKNKLDRNSGNAQVLTEAIKARFEI